MGQLRRVLHRAFGGAAVVLGLGAPFGSDARASLSPLVPTGETLTSNGTDRSEVLVRLEGERILLSERGSPFREVKLANTPDAVSLRVLLEKAGASERSIAVPTGSFTVANGGGQGDSPASTGVPARPKPKAKAPSKPAKRSPRR
jgi:hypothetical protein